jgi:hypothetical protein
MQYFSELNILYLMINTGIMQTIFPLLMKSLSNKPLIFAFELMLIQKIKTIYKYTLLAAPDMLLINYILADTQDNS